MTNLAIPTVHLNGTSKQELLEGLWNAIDKIEEAKRAITLTCPHGRDYYINVGSENNSINEATKQHVSRLMALSKVKSELEEIAFAILQ